MIGSLIQDWMMMMMIGFFIQDWVMMMIGFLI